jgi:hypothetical protein
MVLRSKASFPDLPGGIRPIAVSAVRVSPLTGSVFRSIKTTWTEHTFSRQTSIDVRDHLDEVSSVQPLLVTLGHTNTVLHALYPMERTISGLSKILRALSHSCNYHLR